MNITTANRAALRQLDRIAAVILIFATCTISLAGVQAADLVNSVGGPVAQKPGQIATQTPIKHLIVVVGENHSFDNVFATYVSPDPKQQVWNLLSRGIVNQSGGPGPNFSRAMQNKATDTTAYSLSPTQTGAFRDLPQPNTTLNALPAPPCVVSRFLTERAKIRRGFNFAQRRYLQGQDRR